MAAGFMGQRVRFHNKWLLALLMLLCSCTQKKVFVSADKATTAGGITSVNNKPFTGVLFALYSNADTLFTQSYEDGKEDGEWKEFYPGHQLKEKRYFSNGKKQGKYIAYWENGATRLEYHFSNGEYEGTCSEWLGNGMLVKQMHYENGYEQGPQKAWDNNGKIKSNYVVMNGRRYGLLGTKNCMNVTDSVFNNK